MGREVFVSYKYSDAVDTREEIRKKLGNEGHYYNGEKGFVALQNADSTIKEYLKRMIFGTSVTIVIISPQVIYSDWVDWEIRYSLRQPSRDGRTSYRSGIVCVIQDCKDMWGNYNTSWALDRGREYKKQVFPKAIVENLQTTFPSIESIIKNSMLGDRIMPDYCVIVSESVFKSNPSKYIEEAYNRAHNDEYKVVVNRSAY